MAHSSDNPVSNREIKSDNFTLQPTSIIFPIEERIKSLDIYNKKLDGLRNLR